MTRHSHDFSDRDHDLLFGDDDLHPGDAVVHFEHGLARYDGKTTVDLGDERQTLTTFVYRNGGKLMLPAEEGRDYWAYGAPAGDLTLDRLKTDDWVRRRDEMIAELKESANVLLAEDHARRAQTAPQIAPDRAKYGTFTAAFDHDPTDDQIHATDAILHDLAGTVPMNRLLIGDVGFGKTEVALRAAAAVAFAGFQVVVAAPTTVLARQHFASFAGRFEGTGVQVAELSRLTSASDRDAVLSSIADGSMRIVVSTQAILAEDIALRNLALVIIDEEQKFGRQQKTDLRNLAPGCHILSMTATPIPRSLAAAEVGLLEVSVLAVAPRNRKAIRTTIHDLEPRHLLRAVETEVARGGQCYIVCPRVSDVDHLRGVLAKDGDGFTYTVAHGQMPDDELEVETLRYSSGEVDVLLSTSIVESGLDNPRANTMIVWEADRFGLSQLHQLRGRVGRSGGEAHMLLLTRVPMPLDDAEPVEDGDPAAERLRTFAAISEIGAGFRIARKDRDIRGFGELDGTEQSGQISRLGLGLYRHILKSHLIVTPDARP